MPFLTLIAAASAIAAENLGQLSPEVVPHELQKPRQIGLKGHPLLSCSLKARQDGLATAEQKLFSKPQPLQVVVIGSGMSTLVTFDPPGSIGSGI
ncbi:hypothetical protein Tco_0190493 [Tanacetum coccineum]